MWRLLRVFFFYSFVTHETLSLSFNASAIHTFSALDSSNPSSSPSSSFPPWPKSFIEEALNAIAEKEQWDPEANPRVSAVEAESVRVGAIQSFEFHVRVGGASLVLKFSEEAEAWRKADEGEVRFGLDFVALDESSRQDIKALRLEGPLELRADGDYDELSVYLPCRNANRKGLRRILIDKGVAVEIRGSNEVSLFYPFETAFLLNESSSRRGHKQPVSPFWPLGLFSCPPMVSVRIAGLASLVVFGVPNKKARVRISSLSRNAIELRPDKCYTSGVPASPRIHPASAERLLNGFMGAILLRDPSFRLLKTRITSSRLLRFRAEVERNVTENDKTWEKVAGWRTRPTVERSWFEIMGRSKGGGGARDGRGVKPVVVRKLSRPPMTVESAAWSHLMANISFTEFRFIVVPPEPLTLDVKW